ncbi:MAG TPA: branched-chain amino acid ABC transporter permease [Spirochaetota bacterium]|nr:branched-chain amino acid ABC transporter permease [Spirochaetota bacterium]HOL57398.1 branched-chain amino acid ABC transporter permease [Spirochaetota bacterium]HPP04964.1 branched-chain amino acid ABC transporter permease [Spirochaetota bacterium]
MIDLILLNIATLGIFVILSLSLNLIAGYTGLLSLCHAAFYGVGAYTTAILMTKAHFTFLPSLIISGFIAAFFGFLIGLPNLRLRGDYLAIATLGFSEIVKNIFLNWDSLTGGPKGISEIPPPSIFGIKFSAYNKFQYLILIWIFVAITYFAIKRLTQSRFGRALEAIREDEVATLAMGIDVTKYKVFSFIIGAFFAGIAGSLFSVFIKVVVPNSFDFMLSIIILCMVVLGGMGNNLGAVLGATIIYFASELPKIFGISSLIPPQFNQIIFGLILVLMMIYRPQGIIPRKKIDYETNIVKEMKLRNKK